MHSYLIEIMLTFENRDNLRLGTLGIFAKAKNSRTLFSLIQGAQDKQSRECVSLNGGWEGCVGQAGETSTVDCRGTVYSSDMGGGVMT